jgi:hypothetical protein
MSTFANRHNNPISVTLSESDNDDDNEQNSSFNQQNESMMHKVKDVVSKFLHPSFLFSASGGTTRPKRKRAISIEENGTEKKPESISTATHTTSNGHSTTSKSKYHRRPITDSEPQLTDDEDSNGRDVPSTEQDLTETDQQKKRRRTANYQHIISTTTTNGNHEDERISPPLTGTNGVGSLSNRRIIDNGSNTANTTPVLLQTSIEQNHNEETNRFTSSKQRFNISSTTRPLTPNYDPSQSPLFSFGIRKTTELTMSPSRITTNLKSDTNEFSANYLLATGLANRSQLTTPNTQPSSSTSTNRLSSTERQMFGVNYASINSRRLPYIERLRRRTLQDCIRLNRTLDSEPLSISTIEEHTSTAASPIRKPIKALEKECGIQCNISTTDSSMEPNRKAQRTFPPADIRNEALSVPNIDKVQPSSQTDSSIQTNSSITIEPIKPTNNITKPTVLGQVTPFSWPKFARAQEEYAKKNPEKCRADTVATESSKSTVSSTVDKSNLNVTSSIAPQTNHSSTVPKIPTFSVSPPRPSKPTAGPIWKCPSCTLEHPAQTASCSLCHGINPNYKRLSAIEPTLPASTPVVLSNKTSDIIVEESTVSVPVTTIQSTIQNESTPVTTSSSTATIPITKESTFSMPPFATPTAPFATTSALPLFGTTPTATKETTAINPPATTSISFPSTTTPLFGTTTATFDKPVTSTPTNLFQINTSTSSTFPSFGSATSATNTTAATSTPIAPSIITIPATTASSSPIKIPTSITFGSFGSTPLATTTTTLAAVSSTISSDKPPQFSFGTSAPTLSVPPSSSSTTSAIIPSLFRVPANITASTTITTASLTTSTTSGFSFPNSFPPASISIATTTSSAPLFGSGSSSGFSFPTANTTITTSSSTPFTFGASSPPKTFAPSVISTNGTTPTPAFGATPSFGGTASTTTDKPSTSVPSFPVFGSTPPTSSLFAFGATSNSTTNPIQTSATPAGTTSGFAFSSSSTTAAPAPAFGAVPSTFAFGGAPTFPFGGGSTAAPPSSAPFQFSAVPSATPATNIFSTPSVSTTENNPFSVSEEGTSRRPVIKAKRRANKP